MSRCEKCDLPEGAGCGCHIPDPKRRRSPSEQEAAFSVRARFDSVLVCGHRAETGDWINKTPDGFVCEGCVQ